MLILNEADMRRAITLPRVMDQVENAFRIFASGEFYMPNRPSISHDGNTLLYMPCFLKDCFGTKYLSLFPNNPKRSLPYIDGLMLYNDAETGKTLSIMDGAYLTALRTGAVGGVGIRCFASRNSHSVGVIGTGKQGFSQILNAVEARDIHQVYLYNRTPRDETTYINALKAAMGDKNPEIHVCLSARELVEKSDIVITATSSREPVVPNDPELLRGKHFIAIGSYTHDMRELPDAIWQLVDQVYTEMPYACEESGDLYQPIADGLLRQDQVKYIGDLLTANHRPTPPESGQTTYFKSVGMGLLDLCVAQLIYTEAVRQGLGQVVDL